MEKAQPTGASPLRRQLAAIAWLRAAAALAVIVGHAAPLAGVHLHITSFALDLFFVVSACPAVLPPHGPIRRRVAIFPTARCRLDAQL
ncbi:hypothetical protein [Sphingomonas bacterium]|uniref:hypothetical protein n=1 Tax=Sphingomonas bacterium TaxID=1895847 RepID=UPI00260757EC|nr:hypothetical protein [Sphingomonas bacterium]